MPAARARAGHRRASAGGEGWQGGKMLWERCKCYGDAGCPGPHELGLCCSHCSPVASGKLQHPSSGTRCLPQSSIPCPLLQPLFLFAVA